MNRSIRISGIVIAVIFCASLIIGGLLLAEITFNRQSDHILESWEASNGKFTIKVTTFSEQYNIPPGAYYVFEAVSSRKNKTKIMTVRRDEPLKIDKDGVVFVDDSIAYIYMGWKYAVTTDEGENWAIWDAEEFVSNWECCYEEFIHSVEIDKDGTGNMVTSQMPRSDEVKLLWKTDNYGKNWVLRTKLVE